MEHALVGGPLQLGMWMPIVEESHWLIKKDARRNRKASNQKVHKSSNSALGLMFLSTALAILALVFICIGSVERA